MVTKVTLFQRCETAYLSEQAIGVRDSGAWGNIVFLHYTDLAQSMNSEAGRSACGKAYSQLARVGPNCIMLEPANKGIYG